jgi:hypothetical protein
MKTERRMKPRPNPAAHRMSNAELDAAIRALSEQVETLRMERLKRTERAANSAPPALHADTASQST